MLCVAGQNHRRDEGQRRRRNDEDDDNDEESHVVVVGLCVFGDVSSRSRRAGCAAPSRDRRVSRLSRQRCIERVGCHDKRKLRPSREKRRDASVFSELEFDATVMKRSVSLPILSGAMAFGTWQGLYLCNFKNDNNDNKDDDVLIRTTVRESDFKKTKRGEFVAPRRGCHDATTTIATTVDITDVKMGVLNVMIKHTSASLTINDGRKAEELESGLNTLIPESWNDTFLEHTMEGPDDCPAHIKATILGETMNVPIRDGKLVLSSENEHILLCEHRNVGGYGGGFRREFIATVNEAKAQEVVKLTVDKNRKLVNVSEAVRAFVTKANDATIEVVHVFSPKGGVFMSTADEAEAFLEHLDKKVSSNAVLKSSVIGASEMLVVEDGDGRKMFAEGLECFVVTNGDDGEEEEEEEDGVGLVVFTAL